MQRGSKGRDARRPTQIADLRASLRSAPQVSDAKLPKPPKRPKQPVRDSDEERAIKAEKLAMAQHSTSLLKGGQNAGKDYKRPGERVERKGSAVGFFLQLILVIGVAGGVAYALDPTIVPQEWIDTTHAFIANYVKI